VDLAGASPEWSCKGAWIEPDPSHDCSESRASSDSIKDPVDGEHLLRHDLSAIDCFFQLRQTARSVADR
jgi:hypothetical protein